MRIASLIYNLMSRRNDMNLQDFIGKFAEQFDRTDASLFKADTEFKALEEWSSLSALSVIAMADEEYGVTLKGDDIRNSKTVEDMYNIIKNKK
jgi:acyl carrier protein